MGKNSRTHRRVAPRVRKSGPIHLIPLHVVMVWTGKALSFANVLQTPHYEFLLKNKVVVQLISEIFVGLSEHECPLGYLGLKVSFPIPLNAPRLFTHFFCNIYYNITYTFKQASSKWLPALRFHSKFLITQKASTV